MTELYENMTANMDRQRQTDYTIKPRERYHYDATLYRFRYSYTIAIVISGRTSTNIGFDCVQVLF